MAQRAQPVNILFKKIPTTAKGIDFDKHFDKDRCEFKLLPLVEKKLKGVPLKILNKVYEFTLLNRAFDWGNSALASYCESCHPRTITRAIQKLILLNLVSSKIIYKSVNKITRILWANIPKIKALCQEAYTIILLTSPLTLEERVPNPYLTNSYRFGSRHIFYDMWTYCLGYVDKLSRSHRQNVSIEDRQEDSKKREREAVPISVKILDPLPPSSLSLKENLVLGESSLPPLPNLKVNESSSSSNQELQIDGSDKLHSTHPNVIKIFNSKRCHSVYVQRCKDAEWDHPWYQMVNIIAKVTKDKLKYLTEVYAINLIKAERGTGFEKVKDIGSERVRTGISETQQIIKERNEIFNTDTSSIQKTNSLYIKLKEASSIGNIAAQGIVKRYFGGALLHGAICEGREDFAKIEALLASKRDTQNIPKSLDILVCP